MEADKFMEDFKNKGKESFGSKSGSVLNWIKEAFMGRKLSLTLGGDK
jgi:hypothetical protein